MTVVVGNKTNGESQNGCFKKTKHAKFSKNEDFLPPDTHTLPAKNIIKPYSFLMFSVGKMCVPEVKKYSFFGKFGVLCFLETTVLRSVFLPYYRRGVFRNQPNIYYGTDQINELVSI